MPGGWKGSTRRNRLPADWPAWVTAVRARSGGKCEWIRSSGKRCGRPADGGVDHKDRDKGESLANLQDLCRWHHRHKTTLEGQQAKAEKRDLGRRPQEPHPGLIRRPT